MINYLLLSIEFFYDNFLLQISFYSHSRIQDKQEKLKDLLALVSTIDSLVQEFELEMLQRTFDRDSDDQLVFTWFEVEAYENDAALLIHPKNPFVGDY